MNDALHGPVWPLFQHDLSSTSVVMTHKYVPTIDPGRKSRTLIADVRRRLGADDGRQNGRRGPTRRKPSGDSIFYCV